jgi:Flp pilus assembly protein protease CpaA
MEVFLFALFFAGLIIASISDLIRREVDNYLNLFLGVAGFLFIIFSSILANNYIYILVGLAAFAVVFFLGNLFYYSRVFGGGDSKLLMAMFPVFTVLNFYDTLINIGVFIFFLMLSGSIFGVLYSGALIFRNFRGFKKEFRKNKKLGLFGSVAGVVLLAIGFFNAWFLFLSILTFLFVFLFAFGRAIDKACMVKSLLPEELREGDWLAHAVSYKGRTIVPNWEGLSKKDVRFLNGYKKKILIKDGIPFVPAFLMAFIFWVFRFQILAFVLGFF